MKIYKQIEDNDCAYAILKTFYFYYYNKELKTNLLPKINDVKGLSIGELENIGKNNKLYIQSYSVSYNEFVTKYIDTPFVIVTKKKDNFYHYCIVISKNKKGIKIDDLNNETKFYTYEDFKNIYADIIVSISPNINKMNLKVAGLFEEIDLLKIYKNNIVNIIGMIIFWILHIILMIFILFYAMIIYNINYKNNYIFLLIFIGVGFFALIFNILHNYFLVSLKEKMSLVLKKTFYYHIYYKKLIKHEKLSKSKYFEYESKYNYAIEYFSNIINDYLYLIIINSSVLVILVIYKMFILLLFWMAALLIIGIAFKSFLIIVNKKNIKINNYSNKILEIFSRYCGNTKYKNKNVINSFQKMNEYEKKKQYHLMIKDFFITLITSLDKFATIFFIILVISFFYFTNNENAPLMVILLLLFNFSVNSIKIIQKIIDKNNYIKTK